MLKKTAIDAFGSLTELATACGVTPSAVSQWDDPLPRHAEDKVLAAIVRAGRLPLAGMLEPPKPKAPAEPATAQG